MAWLVTEPEEFAIGFAVALTPPTSVCASTGKPYIDDSSTNVLIVGIYLSCLWRLLRWWIFESRCASEALVQNNVLWIEKLLLALSARSLVCSVMKDLIPENMARIVKKFKDAGATILGGCCETRPSHIEAMAKLK